jgi:hypothetical protein
VAGFVLEKGKGGEEIMKRIITMLMMALVVSAMVTVMAASAAFAVCPVCPVEANDEAQGRFSTGLTHAVPNSDRNAEEGLQTAFMHNTNP